MLTVVILNRGRQLPEAQRIHFHASPCLSSYSSSYSYSLHSGVEVGVVSVASVVAAALAGAALGVVGNARGPQAKRSIRRDSPLARSSRLLRFRTTLCAPTTWNSDSI